MLNKIPNSRVFLHGTIDDHLSILQHSENVLLHRGGISQILFFQGDPPEVSYADRKGKYQGQTGITLAKSK